MDANANLIADMRDGRARGDDPRVTALRAQLDSVAKQRDAYASGLYWYTDLDAAKAEAARTDRHILSLRLLGNLDEEYGCANSRFFRTVLYANSVVSAHLRDHYVRHWKSVRPAPLVTIDMGDGRRIKRTITGNSIHYVLDSDGTVLDALPGLYGPAFFLAALARSETLSKPDAEALRQWHGRQADALFRQWLTDAVKTGMYGQEFAARMSGGRDSDVEACLAEAFPKRHVPSVTASEQTAALGVPRNPSEFEPVAIAKSMVERPISQQTSQSPAPRATVQRPSQTVSMPAATVSASPSDSDKRPLADRMTNEAWHKLAMLRLQEAHLDMSSRSLMIMKLPPANGHSEKDMWEWLEAFDRTLHNFEDAIAQDTVHNEYIFHTQIHQWLEQDTTDRLRHDVEALNKRVYTELFLTPDYDTWLGLVPADTYTALEKDGCACDTGAPPMR